MPTPTTLRRLTGPELSGVVGDGAAIWPLMFGRPLPTDLEIAVKHLRQAWRSRRRCQAMARAFGLPLHSDISDRGVRAAISEVRGCRA